MRELTELMTVSRARKAPKELLVKRAVFNFKEAVTDSRLIRSLPLRGRALDEFYAAEPRLRNGFEDRIMAAVGAVLARDIRKDDPILGLIANIDNICSGAEGPGTAREIDRELRRIVWNMDTERLAVLASSTREQLVLSAVGNFRMMHAVLNTWNRDRTVLEKVLNAIPGMEREGVLNELLRAHNEECGRRGTQEVSDSAYMKVLRGVFGQMDDDRLERMARRFSDLAGIELQDAERSQRLHPAG